MIICPTMPERRSMLQALFGDLRRSTQAASGTFGPQNQLGNETSSAPVSTAVVVTAPDDGSTNEGTSDTTREIELFSLDRPT